MFACYFAVQPWERDGRPYERLGVRVARRFVAGGPFWVARQARRTGRRRLLLPGKRSARRYLRQSVVMEAAHAVSFVLLLAVVVAEWRAGHPIGAVV